MPARALSGTMPIPCARLALAATALAVSAVALAGCSMIPTVDSPPVQADYRTWPADIQPSSPPPPAFVPHDATAMYVRVRMADDAAIITYRSPTQPTGCAPATLAGRPKLDSNWWPDGKLPAEGVLCPSGWQLFDKAGVPYGWRN
jgi:hypothetical protein